MNINELKMLIETDLARYGYSKKNKPTLIMKSALYGFKYTKVLRKTAYYKEKRNYFLFLYFRLYLRLFTFKYGFQISYKTSIGKGLYIGHFGRIIVNSEAKIGDNVNLSPGITIGGTNEEWGTGVPKIGNNVWIGTNAVVVGDIYIDNDVLIAPNAFVNFNVPKHSVVVGNPGIIHKKEKATEYYIQNKI